MTDIEPVDLTVRWDQDGEQIFLGGGPVTRQTTELTITTTETEI